MQSNPKMDALLSKAYYTLFLKQKTKFNSVVDRLLKKYGRKIPADDLIFLYQGIVMVGSWDKMPKIQSLFDNVEMDDMSEELHETWWMIQSVYFICNGYDFQLPTPRLPASSTPNITVKWLDKRLKWDTLKGESAEYVERFKNEIRDENGTINLDWNKLKISTGGEYVIWREGALQHIITNPGMPEKELVGPYLEDAIHCITQKQIDGDKINKITTWYNEIIVLEKQENGNYEGNQWVWINRNDDYGRNLGRLLEYEYEWRIEVE